MKYIFCFCIVLFTTSCVNAQFAPQAGIVGSDAIPSSSSSIVSWASYCTVQRGFLDIAQPSLGIVSSGDSSLALGMADGFVVSLGDSGVATLQFPSPIADGSGPDFAVFENGFLNANNPEEAFLEFAFVEVSSDGNQFFRFPSTSLIPDTFQMSSVMGENFLNARLVHNLAGKHVAGFGTPFDLNELAGITGLDIHRVTHVRLVDVVGSVSSHMSRDAGNRIINDPYPTAFPTGGFDLDGVAVLNQATLHAEDIVEGNELIIYPNPVKETIKVQSPFPAKGVLTDVMGRVQQNVSVEQSTAISLRSLPAGVYWLRLQSDNDTRWTRKIIKY